MLSRATLELLRRSLIAQTGAYCSTPAALTDPHLAETLSNVRAALDEIAAALADVQPDG